MESKISSVFESILTTIDFPSNFDDTYFDKLVEFFEEKVKTDQNVAQLVYQFVLRVSKEKCMSHTESVVLALRLAPLLGSKHQTVVLELVANACSSDLWKTSPLIRNAVFACLTDINVFLEDVSQMALQSLKNSRESIFVRKSAQKFLVKELTLETESTAKILTDICNGFCDISDQSSLSFFSEIMLPYSSEISESQFCANLVNSANTINTNSESYWNLVAELFKSRNPTNKEVLEFVGMKWQSEIGRITVVKCFLDSGMYDQKKLLEILLSPLTHQNGYFSSSATRCLRYLQELSGKLNQESFNSTMEIVLKMVIDSSTTNAKCRSAAVSCLLTFLGLTENEFVNEDHLCQLWNWLLSDILENVDLFNKTVVLLSKLGRPDLLESINVSALCTELLENPYWESRDSAAEVLLVLVEYCPDQFIPKFSADFVTNLSLAIEKDDSHFVRASDITLLQELWSCLLNEPKTEAAERVISVLINDDNPLPRRAAAQFLNLHINDILSLVPWKVVSPAVIASSKDTDREVLLYLIEILDKLVESSDKHEFLVNCASNIMSGDYCNERTVQFLEKLAKVVNPQLKIRIEELLSKYGDIECDGGDLYSVKPELLLDDILRALNYEDTIDADCY